MELFKGYVFNYLYVIWIHLHEPQTLLLNRSQLFADVFYDTVHSVIYLLRSQEPFFMKSFLSATCIMMLFVLPVLPRVYINICIFCLSESCCLHYHKLWRWPASIDRHKWTENTWVLFHDNNTSEMKSHIVVVSGTCPHATSPSREDQRYTFTLLLRFLNQSLQIENLLLL